MSDNWDPRVSRERRPGIDWGERTAGMSDDEKARLLFRLSKKQQHYEFELDLPHVPTWRTGSVQLGAPRAYPYQVPSIYWDRKSWWRFKRAAFGQQMSATTLLRRLMTDAIVEYERTLDRAVKP